MPTMSRTRMTPPALLLVVLVTSHTLLMTSRVSAVPTGPLNVGGGGGSPAAVPGRDDVTAESERDGRVWDMLRQESRSFMTALLPDAVAARAHDVLWSAPLHERAVREHRIPRYTVLAMAGPPMLQSHDTDLLDAALAPAVAGDFGRKGNGLRTDAVPVTSPGGQSRPRMTSNGGDPRQPMTHETELMPNSLTAGYSGVGGGDEAQAIAGEFGQRGAPRPVGSAVEIVIDEAAPGVEAAFAPSESASPIDVMSGFSSFPLTERVPYVQNIQDFDAEKKKQQGASPPATDDVTPPTLDEFPFDSLKMEATGEGASVNEGASGQSQSDQSQFPHQESGDSHTDSPMSFDTSNFPNFPKFSFPQESGYALPKESGYNDGQQSDVSAFDNAAAQWFNGDNGDTSRFNGDNGGQNEQQLSAERETMRFPMFPEEQQPVNEQHSDSDMMDMKTFREANIDEQDVMPQEVMKDEAPTTVPPNTEEVMSGEMVVIEEDHSPRPNFGSEEIKGHTGNLPLAPVTDDKNSEIPTPGEIENQFENFKEGGAYPELSLGGFPSFPDIPGSPDRPASQPDQEEDNLSTEPESNLSTSSVANADVQLPVEPSSLQSTSSRPEQFGRPDVFTEADLFSTSDDAFYDRLEMDPTFQTPTAPDLSFNSDTRAPLGFPELRTRFPAVDTDFSRDLHELRFPDLKTRFPQAEVDFAHTQDQVPEFPSFGGNDEDDDDDAFASFAEVADLGRDPADDVTVFTDEEKMNDRRAINYHSPAQFGSRSPANYNHFNKNSGKDEFQNTFFQNDFNRVTTQRPTTPRPSTTTSQKPEVKIPHQQHQRPHVPGHPQGPPRPYPYRPREHPHGDHTTTTTYRPAIFVNEGPRFDGKNTAAQKDVALQTVSTPKPSGQSLFPDRNSIPGYIPRPTRPRPHHQQTVPEHHSAPMEEPRPEPVPEQPAENVRKIPGYLPRPTRPTHHRRAPHGQPTKHAKRPLYQLTSPTLSATSAPEEHMATTEADQPEAPLNVDVRIVSAEPSNSPDTDEIDTTVPETVAPTATATETAPPPSSDLSSLMTQSETTSDPTPVTTSQPPTRRATRKPYTFPPFRRRTTPPSFTGSDDVTTSQFAPEFGTRITHKKPASSIDSSAARRQPGERRPAEVAGHRVRGSSYRPGMRRGPPGGRRGGRTQQPSQTTPMPSSSVEPTVETIDEETIQEVQSPAVDVAGGVEEEVMTDMFVEEQGDNMEGVEAPEDGPELTQVADEFDGFEGPEVPVQNEDVEVIPESLHTMDITMPEDSQMPDETTSSEEGQTAPGMSEFETMQLQPEDQTQEEEDVSSAGVFPEDNEDGGFISEEISDDITNPEISTPIVLAPVLSEESLSTAEPMTEGNPVPTAPGIDNIDTNDVPAGSEGIAPVTSEQEQVTSELPEGIFEVQPTAPQTQEGEEIETDAREEDVPSIEFDPSLLAGSVDLRSNAEPVEALEVFEDDAAVAANDASGTQEGSFETNTLGAFAALPETDGDVFDVAAVLQQELADEGGDEADGAAVEVFDSPLTDEGTADSFFAGEPLQTLNDEPSEEFTGSGLFTESSNPSEDSVNPLSSPQEDAGFGVMAVDPEQQPEMVDFTSPVIEREGEIQNFESTGSASPATMPVSEVEQTSVMSDGLSAMPMPDSPEISDIGDMSIVPDTPEMSSELPEESEIAIDDMSAHTVMTDMAMTEMDSSDTSMLNGLPEAAMVDIEETDDVTMMMPSVTQEETDVEQQYAVPSETVSDGDAMSEEMGSDDVVPMMHDQTPGAVEENQAPFLPVSNDGNDGQTENEDGGSQFEPVSDSQEFGAPENVPASVQSEFEPSKMIPEGFGPVHASSLLPESEETAMEDNTMNDMAEMEDFQSFSNSAPETSPEEDGVEAPAEQTPFPAESDEAMFTGGFDMPVELEDDVTQRVGGDSFSDDVDQSEGVAEDHRADADAPGSNFELDMMAEPTSDGIITTDGVFPIIDDGPSNIMSDGVIGDMDLGVPDQGQYLPRENQQFAEDDFSAGSFVPEDAPFHDDSPVVDSSYNVPDEQTPDIDIRISAGPVTETEEADFPSQVTSATESDIDAVDVVSDQEFAPVEAGDEADVEQMFEDQFVNQEGFEGVANQEQDQNLDAEEQNQELEDVEQDVQEEENEENNLELQEEEAPQEGEDTSQSQQIPSGYGAPHSDSIVPVDITGGDVTVGDVKADDDVIVPEEEGVPQMYGDVEAADVPGQQST